jgi:hypothetical protein
MTAAPAKELMAITVAIYSAESAGREEEATEICCYFAVCVFKVLL